MGTTESTCCRKNNGAGNEIVCDRPVTAPGVESDEPFAAAKDTAECDPEPSPTSDKAAPTDTSPPPVRNSAAWAMLKAQGGQNYVEDKEEIYDDGSSYAGQVVDGRRQGRGVWASTAEQYSGFWKNDQRDGHGRQTWQDGRLYEGQFKDGKFHGFGRMEWHTPLGVMQYEGDYVDDVKHGAGKYFWPDNRIYDGQWADGKRNGRATYTNTKGERRKGIWKDDMIERWLDDDADTYAPDSASSHK